MVMVFFTIIGDKGLFWITLGIIFCFFKKTRKCGILLLISITAGFLIGEVTLKHIFCRERPFFNNKEFQIGNLLITVPQTYSFPSGHTTYSCAAAYTVCRDDKRLGVGAYIIAFLIAFSRMYLYVHYPSDIFAGVLLGTACAIITNAIFIKVQGGKNNGRVKN